MWYQLTSPVCISFLSAFITTTTLHPFNGLFSRTTWVSRYQKGKTSLDLNEAREDGVSGCGFINWTMCKWSAPRSTQITTPTTHHSTNSVRALKAPLSAFITSCFSANDCCLQYKLSFWQNKIREPAFSLDDGAGFSLDIVWHDTGITESRRGVWGAY